MDTDDICGVRRDSINALVFWRMFSDHGCQTPLYLHIHETIRLTERGSRTHRYGNRLRGVGNLRCLKLRTVGRGGCDDSEIELLSAAMTRQSAPKDAKTLALAGTGGAVRRWALPFSGQPPARWTEFFLQPPGGTRPPAYHQHSSRGCPYPYATWCFSTPHIIATLGHCRRAMIWNNCDTRPSSQRRRSAGRICGFAYRWVSPRCNQTSKCFESLD
jgi:hypothetical protein